MITEIIKIEGMMCGHCQATVEKAIGAVDGVNEVNVDLATKQATVNFDPAVASLDSIKAAIKNAGYTVVG